MVGDVAGVVMVQQADILQDIIPQAGMALEGVECIPLDWS